MKKDEIKSPSKGDSINVSSTPPRKNLGDSGSNNSGRNSENSNPSTQDLPKIEITNASCKLEVDSMLRQAQTPKHCNKSNSSKRSDDSDYTPKRSSSKKRGGRLKNSSGTRNSSPSKSYSKQHQHPMSPPQGHNGNPGYSSGGHHPQLPSSGSYGYPKQGGANSYYDNQHGGGQSSQYPPQNQHQGGGGHPQEFTPPRSNKSHHQHGGGVGNSYPPYSNQHHMNTSTSSTVSHNRQNGGHSNIKMNLSNTSTTSSTTTVAASPGQMYGISPHHGGGGHYPQGGGRGSSGNGGPPIMSSRSYERNERGGGQPPQPRHYSGEEPPPPPHVYNNSGGPPQPSSSYGGNSNPNYNTNSGFNGNASSGYGYGSQGDGRGPHPSSSHHGGGPPPSGGSHHGGGPPLQGGPGGYGGHNNNNPHGPPPPGQGGPPHSHQSSHGGRDGSNPSSDYHHQQQHGGGGGHTRSISTGAYGPPRGAPAGHHGSQYDSQVSPAGSHHGGPPPHTQHGNSAGSSHHSSSYRNSRDAPITRTVSSSFEHSVKPQVSHDGGDNHGGFVVPSPQLRPKPHMDEMYGAPPHSMPQSHKRSRKDKHRRHSEDNNAHYYKDSQSNRAPSPPGSPMAIRTTGSDLSWHQLQNVASVEEPYHTSSNQRRQPVEETSGKESPKRFSSSDSQASSLSTHSNPKGDDHRHSQSNTDRHAPPPPKLSSLDSLSDVASIQEPIDTSASKDSKEYDIVLEEQQDQRGNGKKRNKKKKKNELNSSSSDSSGLGKRGRSQETQGRHSKHQQEPTSGGSSRREHRREKSGSTSRDRPRKRHSHNPAPDGDGRVKYKASPMSISKSPPGSPGMLHVPDIHSRRRSGGPPSGQSGGGYPKSEDEGPTPYNLNPSCSRDDSMPSLPAYSNSNSNPANNRHNPQGRPESSSSSSQTTVPRLGVQSMPSWDIQGQDSFTGGGRDPTGFSLNSFSFASNCNLSGLGEGYNGPGGPPAPQQEPDISGNGNSGPPGPSYPAPESRNQSFEGHYHSRGGIPYSASGESRGGPLPESFSMDYGYDKPPHSGPSGPHNGPPSGPHGHHPGGPPGSHNGPPGHHHGGPPQGPHNGPPQGSSHHPSHHNMHSSHPNDRRRPESPPWGNAPSNSMGGPPPPHGPSNGPPPPSHHHHGGPPPHHSRGSHHSGPQQHHSQGSHHYNPNSSGGGYHSQGGGGPPPSHHDGGGGYHGQHGGPPPSHRNGPPPPSHMYSNRGPSPQLHQSHSYGMYRTHSDDGGRRTSPPMMNEEHNIHPGFQAPRHEFSHSSHQNKPPPTVYIVSNTPRGGPHGRYGNDPSLMHVNGGNGSHGSFGWSPEDDSRLTEVMKKFKNPTDWDPVAKEHLRGKTAKQCHERWIRYLKPGVRKGQWQDHEDAIVVEAVTTSEEQPFTRWSDLAQRLPGRVGKQIRDRWVNHLNPHINHMPFTRDDDLLLFRGHQELGKRWVEISTKFFNSTRSENHIKNRWYSASFKKFIANEYGADAYSKSGGGGKEIGKGKNSKNTKTTSTPAVDEQEEEATIAKV